MKKTAALIATLITPLFLLPLLLTAALVTQSCGNGESVGNSTSSSSGGSTGSSSGGSGNPSSGSGGSLVNLGSGGANVNQGSGGASTSSSSGGSSTTGTGGASTASGSGGSTVLVGNGSGGSTLVTGGGGTTVTTGGGMDSTFSTDGYGMNTAWMGYLFTAKWGTATIAPLTPTMMFPTGKQICANGSVPADLTGMGASGALVGWNINQAKASTTEGSWTPTGTGVSITLSGMTTGLRLQIEDGSTPAKQWCVIVNTPTVKVPWTMFNTMCYGADPTAAASAFNPATPIKKIEVVVPSSSVTANFNFCWIDATLY